MPAKFKFEKLLEAAKGTGELRSGDADYVLGLWRSSADLRHLEHAKEGLKIERQNMRKACQTIARLTLALEAVETVAVRIQSAIPEYAYEMNLVRRALGKPTSDSDKYIPLTERRRLI